jgi:hypothetical protein
MASQVYIKQGSEMYSILTAKLIEAMVEGDYRPQEKEAAFDAGLPSAGIEVTSFAALQEQGNPEVLELLSVLYDAYTVQQSLGHDATVQQHNVPETSTSSLEQYGTVVSIDPPFAERYRRGSLFVAAAVHIMRGSFEAYPEDPEYIRAITNAAFAPYGYMVAEGTVPIVTNYPFEYRYGLDKQREKYETLGKGRQTSHTQLEFFINADDQWEAEGQWQNAPEVAQFAEQLTTLHRLRLRMPDIGIMLRHMRSAEDAVYIPGLHPYYKERYDFARSVFEETQGAMTEGIGIKSDYYRWLISLVHHFNDALYDLDMHIDVNPLWTPEQVSQPVLEGSQEHITIIEEVTE